MEKSSSNGKGREENEFSQKGSEGGQGGASELRWRESRPGWGLQTNRKARESIRKNENKRKNIARGDLSISN